MASKLTKKQKKASEFRNRKRKQDDEELDVPISDLAGQADDGFGIDDSSKQDESLTKQINGSKSRKRKREDDDDPKDVVVDEELKSSNEANATDEPPKKRKKTASKYILFVGNLSYKTTVDSISKHFSACDPPPSIRLLTAKGRTVNDVNKPDRSKGCAFLEFSKASGLQTALRLHHSELDGRRINVELSAGGGGKSEKRLKKLQSKNANLDKHRGKAAVEPSEGEGLKKTVARSRHSSTSGTKAELTTKKTWSVPKDGEIVGRGGQRHRKPSKNPGKERNGRLSGHNRRPSRPARATSGANAIPLG